MVETIPIVPVWIEDLGRDFYTDGMEGSTSDYLSEVKVINITPYQVEEIKTSVITLEQDMFPVPELPNDPNTTPISVSSSDNELGYVQWEPMGDLYAPTLLSPYGSYKYLRVKWDCYIPAGSNTANYTVNGTVPGPYEYYAEKVYVFRALEPQSVPSFTLTPGVLSAVGALGNKPIKFQFSAHGYVNEFDLKNGLYGQDIQTDYPDGSALVPATRDPIYNRFFGQIGTSADIPTNTGEQCLAKEFKVTGRIVPELDISGAHFDRTTLGTSGTDAPPFFYQLHYELQNNKNIIPFTFVWGIGLLTYDSGTYDPRGKTIDKQDINGVAGEGPKTSSNHGSRRRSPEWLAYLNEGDDTDTSRPNIFHSNEDITFSVIGPQIVCHASSVNVCAVYNDTYNGMNRTIMNWFDKANLESYDIDVYGVNFLPMHMAWVLRGAIHINSTYAPVSLTQKQSDSQSSNRLERTWAIDQNFESRKLFTLYRNTMPSPPDELLEYTGYDDKYQTAAYLANNLWDDTSIEVAYNMFPTELVTEAPSPYYNNPDFLTVTGVGFLKGLKEPWAMNPIGLNARPGVAGEQPGFTFIGPAATNAAAGMPDLRAIEACVDLEFNRCFVEANRDGTFVDILGDTFSAKRFMKIPGTITNYALNNYGASFFNNPSYSGWLDKSINSTEFSGLYNFVKESPVLCFFGLNPTYSGSSARHNFNRGFGGYGSTPKNLGFQQFRPNGTMEGPQSDRRYNPDATNVGYPIPKRQANSGYPNNGLFYANERQAYTNSHSAYALQMSYALASGDKLALELVDYYIKVVMSSHDDAEHGKTFFAREQIATGQMYFNVGRMEGRPLQGLIAGLGITRNRQLRERAIYSLSRRFWNFTRVTNFEHFPEGVPGKPWRTVWYPPWAGSGFKLSLDANRRPVVTEYLQSNTIFADFYNNYYSLAGDPAWKLYYPSQLHISALNPNFVSSNAATWNYSSADQLQRRIWVDPYLALQTGSPSLLAVSADLSFVGDPATLPSSAQIPYRYTVYRLSDVDEPLRDVIINPAVGGSIVYNRSTPLYKVYPLYTQVPYEVLSQNPASRYVGQGYQNALLYGFTYPMIEVFNNYAQIYAARVNNPSMSSIDFPCRHSSMATLAEEYADTYENQVEHYLRVAKALVRNLLAKFSNESAVAANHLGIRYFTAPYSPSKLLENFSDSERVITLDSGGNAVSLPYGGQYPTGSSPSTLIDRSLFETYTTGAEFQVRNNINGVAGGNPYSTAMWAFNAILLAWDLLYYYGDITDPVTITLLEDARSYIEDYIGTEQFNLADAIADTDLRTHYLKFWGTYGWPSPGNSPPSLQGLLGDNEGFPWFAGVARDLWRSRELDQISIEGSVIGSLDLDGEISYTRDYISLGTGDVEGSLIPSSTLSVIHPEKAYLLDQGFSSVTSNTSAYVLATTPSDGQDVYVLAYFFDSDPNLDPLINKFTLNSALHGSFLGELISQGYVASAALLRGEFEGSMLVATEVLSRSVSLAEMSVIKEIDLDLSDLSVFIALPSIEVQGELDGSATSLALSVNITNEFLSELIPSGSPSLGIGIRIQDDWIGETIPISTFTDLNPHLDFLGEALPEALISIIAGSTEGQSQGGSFVSMSEKVVTSSTLETEFTTANAFYTGIRKNMKHSFERELFKELITRSKGQAKVSEIYRETLEYLINTFASLIHITDQNDVVNIPCWHGAAERVIARLKKEANVVLPVISVYRVSNESDPDRRRSSSIIVYNKYWNKETNRAVRVASLAPVPVNIQYRINVWAKYHEDLDQITEQIHRMFNPDMEIYTKYNSSTKAFLIEEDSNIDINIVDGEDRVLKKVFTISVESYIPSPKFVITNTGEIETFNAEVLIPIK